MSWVEVDGAGWKWVHGLVISSAPSSLDLKIRIVCTVHNRLGEIRCEM